MLRKKFAWIILILGLMINNIGFAIIIGESFDKPLFLQNKLYKTYEEKEEEMIIIDEEIPGGEAVQKNNQKLLGYKLYVLGLIVVLIYLVIRKVK
ncbi:hypothetical protein [Cellulosilyticum sp. I15G10I2]|uniref:hypothetical protein n=1 Tax=Cellulosilyticum sp. I15G10I2 TaxID=1892843 RepID=UPI00085BB20A|nr:hypothetical protein [Cellulosilyticum sp. I15G10I2]